MQLSVVVLDDDEVALAYFERLFKKAAIDNWNLYIFSNQAKCLTHLTQMRTDALWVDYRMPIQNGIEFFESIPVQISNDIAYYGLCTADISQDIDRSINQKNIVFLDKATVYTASGLVRVLSGIEKNNFSRPGRSFDKASSVRLRK